MKSIRNTKYKIRDTESGQALLTAVIFFLVGSLIIVAGIAGPVVRDIRGISDVVRSKQSYLFAEGANEEVMYRVQNAYDVDNTETLTDGDFSATVTIEDEGGERQITSVGNQNELYRKVYTTLSLGEGTAFNYGIQTDDGGLIMNNNAAVRGSVYSNGTITAANGAAIYGDAVSAGDDGFFQGHATGTVYANFINNSQIEGDAYYQIISNSTVGGTQYPGSSNQPPIDLPDLSAQIDGWESNAESGGTATCTSGTYKIRSNTTLGPIKVPCDLEIENGASVTLLGNVWAEGIIKIENNATITISPSLGGGSVAIIADDPANRTSGSYINVNNNVSLFGTGEGSSSIMLVSRNEAEDEGIAINYNNNGADNDLVLFAPKGFVNLNNNASLSSIVAYIVNINNNTEIVYKTGLANLLFTSGPSGGYTLDSWKEVQ